MNQVVMALGKKMLPRSVSSYYSISLIIMSVFIYFSNETVSTKKKTLGKYFYV